MSTAAQPAAAYSTPACPMRCLRGDRHDTKWEPRQYAETDASFGCRRICAWSTYAGDLFHNSGFYEVIDLAGYWRGARARLLRGVRAERNMANGGGMWGSSWMSGYGGLCVPLLLVVVVGAIVWAVIKSTHDQGRMPRVSGIVSDSPSRQDAVTCIN